MCITERKNYPEIQGGVWNSVRIVNRKMGEESLRRGGSQRGGETSAGILVLPDPGDANMDFCL